MAQGVVASSDGNLYVMAEGFSIELTAGQTQDIFLLAVGSATGALSYFMHYGGPDPEYGSDIKEYGAYLYILGYTNSKLMTTGFQDNFCVCTLKTG